MIVIMRDAIMPDCCNTCVCSEGYGCGITGTIMTTKEMESRPDWCPLEEVEPCEDAVSRKKMFETVAEYEKQLREIYGDENELVETVKILKHRLLIELPSVQPEPSTDIQEILDYLDTTLHPIVSPDNWYVYAELHDMISTLSSVQPDNSCDGCKYENSDDGVLVPCGFCKRSHPDNYERRTDELD